MANKVESIKHLNQTRVHIPSKEEAGYEDANPLVIKGRKIMGLPKNPVISRGQDPELFWLNKYGNDDRDEILSIDIRSLYRHEHIAPEKIIKGLYKVTEEQSSQLSFNINELFGNALEKDELEKVSEYYQHQDGWTNRLIQGDSLLVMASLLEREGMAGTVQTIYFDPPYGIKYGSNWQVKLNNRDVKDGSDDSLTGEPEQIKAFRDTWEHGIHSYLSYLRDRLIISKELLTDSGSCFVQISDENVHLVRNLLDEIFGSDNYISDIIYVRAVAGLGDTLSNVNDHILWYAKQKENIKYRPLFVDRSEKTLASAYNNIEDPNGNVRRMKVDEIQNPKDIQGRRFKSSAIVARDISATGSFDFEFNGITYKLPPNSHWKTSKKGLENLIKLNRIVAYGKTLTYKMYSDDFPHVPLSNIWDDVFESTFAVERLYVVQTQVKVIQRCLLMTTDPGDLVLDPTCGSGTMAYVAEQWGRRWLTIDTSRIALNITKERLLTAVFPYYKLYDEKNNDVRQGFIYKTVPHITLKSLANDEPPATETLYDQPELVRKVLRVSGSFTVETLQNFEPINPEELDEQIRSSEQEGAFEEVIKAHLLSAGVKNGRKDEQVVFTRVELLNHGYLHAEGFYQTSKGESKAYFHIGPKFGTVSKKAVSEAVRECQSRGDAAWLIILGFSFESEIQGGEQTTSQGNFEVTKARIHDDLLQEGLKKKPAKSAASFVTIGEPDIDVIKEGNQITIEIKGLDIYDPIKDEVKARNISDIAYWMVDDNYDGSNFILKQVFFCGGDKTEFDKWQKGLSDIAKLETKKKAEKTLKIDIDDDAFDRLYGYKSHPIEIKNKDQKIAVRVLSQYGEETTKVITF